MDTTKPGTTLSIVAARAWAGLWWLIAIAGCCTMIVSLMSL